MAATVPESVRNAAKELGEKKVVDLMAGSPDPDDPTKVPSLKNGVPSIVVVTSPTELVVTDGKPDWTPMQGTMLLYVKNTTANVFKVPERPADVRPRHGPLVLGPGCFRAVEVRFGE